ncbi:RNA methyltransferase [Actinidia chinensis var. chinensis]|uniref:RNA methyltransferase n=1 Tax=Actinidia chinensis var. chinensis TaxID=1590841 RepID=A0A2R6RKM5_ACTCC|nr:RNA methyltransferase [Actinidia chinensis var. chinensis]
MVVVEARKLSLPQTPSVSSLLFDPSSLSLALMHSDSSLSLYPSLSPLSLASLPPPQTTVPSPSSSAAFLRLHGPNPNSNPRVLFVAAAPLRGGAAVLLRFWILLGNTQSFAKSRVVCNQTGLEFDDHKSGVVFRVRHGASVKLVGSINVFVMYSVSNSKIWVFSARMVDDDDNSVTVKLMKCAVIDCCVPVFAISISFGFLILGEENGVRVFPLRPLVKGRVKRENRKLNNGLSYGKLGGQRLNLPNGVSQKIHGSEVLYDDSVNSKVVENSSNGYLEEKSEKHCDSVKLKSVKLRQDSRASACFVELKKEEVESCKPTKVPLQSTKAVSIQALSPNKFLIVDSAGELQLLCLSNPVLASEIPCHVKLLTASMKVEKLAVLPDISTRTQTVWISDGCNTVHMLAVPGMDTSAGDSDRKDSEEKLSAISVIQAIFASEKIQDVIPLATNAILILGQGSLFAYTIS